MTDLDMEFSELLQLCNYGIGGHYQPHFDMAREDKVNLLTASMEEENGNRMASLLYYLSTPLAGGGTVFPSLNIAVSATKQERPTRYVDVACGVSSTGRNKMGGKHMDTREKSSFQTALQLN
ncbi:unnamed protein product [Soboliphyme baturini]|uniref:Fe2OG dioxygenase domain-containing protein n=1 Tax=Soboliphyme baturini TaxID=241478 RepID=A0A183IHW1_9BILA|nr:unnamed protein product [Soboliphyme baturini]